MTAKPYYGTMPLYTAIAFVLEPCSDSEISDLENNDDGTDQTHIPPELDHESDCDEVSDESYSCRSTDQN